MAYAEPFKFSLATRSKGGIRHIEDVAKSATIEMVLTSKTIQVDGLVVARDWMIGAVTDREGRPGVGAVHGTGGRVYETLDPRVAATFQHVQEAHDIGFDVCMRIRQRAPDARLRRQMHDPSDGTPLRENGCHGLAAGDVLLNSPWKKSSLGGA